MDRYPYRPQPKPVLRMGATRWVGEFAYPFTVIRVRRKGKQLIVRADRVTMTGGAIENKTGEKIVVTRRPDGLYRQVGLRLRETWEYWTLGTRIVKVPDLTWDGDYRKPIKDGTNG